MTAKEAYEYLKDKKISNEARKVFHLDKAGVYGYALLNEDGSVRFLLGGCLHVEKYDDDSEMLWTHGAGYYYIED